MKINFEKRYVVKLGQKTNKPVKAWRVTDFIEKVNNSYYKKELLKEIEERLYQGEDPKNIIILDKSFNIHKAYKGLGIIKMNTSGGAKHLYHLGKPYSLYPNEKIIITNNIYGTFSTLYKLFNKYKVKLDKASLKDILKEAFKNPNDLKFGVLNVELEQALEAVGDIKDINNLKDKVYELTNELKLNIEFELKQAQQFLQLDDEIKNSYDLEKRLKDTKDKKYKDLLNSFPNKFARYFVSTIRPIVGVYNPQKNIIEILASNFIKKDGHDERQIDLKSVTHNSPFTVVIIGGITLVISLYQMHCNKYDKKAIMHDEDDEVFSSLLEFDFDEDEDVQDELESGQVIMEEWQETKEALENVINEFETNDDTQKEDILEEVQSDLEEIRPTISRTLVLIENRVQIYFDKAFENNEFKEGTIKVTKEKKEETEFNDAI